MIMKGVKSGPGKGLSFKELHRYLPGQSEL